ncbi:hypothetical protein GMSM_16120 [Geomonas sp. Red276]
MRKGLATLVCLTLVAVVWAWAATAYSTYWVETKTTTLGGSIKVANNTALAGVGAIRFTSFTTANAVPVTVTPDSGYKISTVTVDNVAQTVPATGAYTYNSLQTPDHTVKIVAGFVGANATTSAAKTWQLQIQNGSAGGTISAAGHSVASYGMKMYNFSDTTAIPVTVAPSTGFYVSSLYVNGVLQSGFATTGGTYTVDPSVTGKVFNVTANYKKQVNVVTTNTGSTANGILPVNPKVAYGNDVKLIVAPMAPYNTVTGITVTGSAYSAISMVDSQGNTAAPFKGSVVVTISKVTGPLNISYAAGTDNTGQMGGCTNTCHLSASAAVQAVPAQWNASNHKRNAVDCVSCHQTMPGPWTSDTVNKATMTIGSTVVCSKCHADANVEGFLTSPHWTNLRNNGDSAVAGDQLATCATNKCHFKSANQTGCATCHRGNAAGTDNNINADGTFAGYSANSVAHDPYTPTMESTCWRCHQGSHHGTPTAAYQKSAHYLNPYYMYGDKEVACQDCHDPHSTKATFPGYDATTYAKTTAGACDSCHARTPGRPYGIFSSNGQMVAPHVNQSGSAASSADNSNYLHGFSANAGWYSAAQLTGVTVNVQSQYVTPNNSCTDCHGHNNYINAEYATTMHADPNGRWKAIDGFKFAGYSAATATVYTPANVKQDGCVRCHTATGFVNFVQSGFQDLRAWGFANKADATGEVITCRACHVTGKGAISGEAEVGLPEGNPNNWNPNSIRAAKTPYTMYYNYSVSKVKKFVGQAKFNNFGYSNVCVPCHSGRTGATDGSAIKALGAYANYTTLTFAGTPSLPHGVYQAAILDAKLGYKFSAYTTAANGHATIGVNSVVTAVNGNASTDPTPGPCVSCHMDFKTQTGEAGKTATYRKHEFSIVKADGSLPTLCANCHSASFNGASLDDAKANFQAAVVALAEVMKTSNNVYGTPIVTGATVTQYGTTSYKWSWADNKRGISGVSFTGKSAKFADLVGAYYNLQLLWGVAFSTTDEGAYAHNPQYLKQLVNDTINALRAPSTASVADAISQLGYDNASADGYFPGFSAATQDAAITALNNANNHYAAGATKTQYMISTASCTDCHNPNETALQAAARVAWSESDHGLTSEAGWGASLSSSTRGSATPYNGTAIPSAECVRCHTVDGFLQFTNGGAYASVAPLTRTDAGKVNSPLNCNACHVSPLPTGNDRRSIAQTAGTGNGTSGVGAVIFYNISAVDNGTHLTYRARTQANFPDVQDSNLCVTCHSGRGTGQHIATIAANPNFTISNVKSRPTLHNLPVAGVMYMKVAFASFTSASASYPTLKNYTSVGTATTYAKTVTSSLDLTGGVTSTHRLLGSTAVGHGLAAGVLSTGGPCVTCHMQGNGTSLAHRADGGHSLDINADAFNQVCINCHTSENGHALNTFSDFQTYFLDAQAEAYNSAVTLASTLLAQNYGITTVDDNTKEMDGITTVTDYTRKAWLTANPTIAQSLGAAVQTDGNGNYWLTNAAAAKLMGAAYNVALYSYQDKAAFAHARTATRRSLYDTIDFLDDGAMNFSVSATATTMMPAVYGIGSVAYTQDGSANATTGIIQSNLDVMGTGTTEASLFLFNWNRTYGNWNNYDAVANSPLERP